MATRSGAEPEPLKFEKTGTWARAEANGIIVKPYKGRHFVVRLTDSESGHVCSLSRDGDGEYRGYCSCRGYQYHDGPCTHLWALRIAERDNAVDLPEEPVGRPPSCPQCGRVYCNVGDSREV